MFDVVVVGARCAGASVAMLLARRGHRVALVDRATFPSDTMSTHFLWQRGAARLQAWGLLDLLEQRGCLPIDAITFDSGPVQLRGLGPPVEGVRQTYCPRRTVLDALLVEAAVDAGAELIEDFSVREVERSAGRVVGVSGHRRGGADRRISGGVVVGADGLHSTVAKKVGARTHRKVPPLTCVYYSYWAGVRHVPAAFHVRDGRLVLTWPTNDDLTCIYVAWLHDELHDVRHDVERSFHDALELVPGLPEIVAAGTRVQRFTGTGDLPNFYRTSAGPGWALVGDAGHHKDPSTGMGMSDAFGAAELLADALHRGLTGEEDLDTALAGYETARDAQTADGFALTLSTARLAPLSPSLDAFYRSAEGDAALTERIFGVLGGTIPVADVFSRKRPAELGVRR